MKNLHHPSLESSFSKIRPEKGSNPSDCGDFMELRGKKNKITIWGKTPSCLINCTAEGGINWYPVVCFGVLVLFLGATTTSSQIYLEGSPPKSPPSPPDSTPRPLQVGSMSRETKRPFCEIYCFARDAGSIGGVTHGGAGGLFWDDLWHLRHKHLKHLETKAKDGWGTKDGKRKMMWMG